MRECLRAALWRWFLLRHGTHYGPAPRTMAGNDHLTTQTYDVVGNLTGVDYPAGTTDLAMAYDALNRLTNRVDAAGTTRYSYAMLGSGRRTMSESGLWATDTVTVTNRYGRRAGLTIQQPSSSFIVTNAWDAAGR